MTQLSHPFPVGVIQGEIGPIPQIWPSLNQITKCSKSFRLAKYPGAGPPEIQVENPQGVGGLTNAQGMLQSQWRKHMTYHRTLATLLIFLMAMMCAAVLPIRAVAACSATTIQGTYGWRLNPLVLPNAPKSFLNIGAFSPSVFVGQIVFDGNNSISGFLAGNAGGVPQSSTFTGTYSVNADCTGTVTRVISGGVREYEIAIVQGGAEIEFANTNGSPNQVVGEGVAERAPAATCSTATIAGNYGFKFGLLFSPPSSTHASLLQLGSFEPGDLAGLIVFNSSNNTISGLRSGNTGGIPVSSTFTGTYSVNADCTGTVNLVLADQIRQYAITIVQDGAEIGFANTIVTSLEKGPIFQIVGGGVAKRQ